MPLSTCRIRSTPACRESSPQQGVKASCAGLEEKTAKAMTRTIQWVDLPRKDGAKAHPVDDVAGVDACCVGLQLPHIGTTKKLSSVDALKFKHSVDNT